MIDYGDYSGDQNEAVSSLGFKRNLQIRIPSRIPQEFVGLERQACVLIIEVSLLSSAEYFDWINKGWLLIGIISS